MTRNFKGTSSPNPIYLVAVFSNVISRERASLVSHLITATFSAYVALQSHRADHGCSLHPLEYSAFRSGVSFLHGCSPPTPGTGPGTEWALHTAVSACGERLLVTYYLMPPSPCHR